VETMGAEAQIDWLSLSHCGIGAWNVFARKRARLYVVLLFYGVNNGGDTRTGNVVQTPHHDAEQLVVSEEALSVHDLPLDRNTPRRTPHIVTLRACGA
jgi:hypothetical protein